MDGFQTQRPRHDRILIEIALKNHAAGSALIVPRMNPRRAGPALGVKAVDAVDHPQPARRGRGGRSGYPPDARRGALRGGGLIGRGVADADLVGERRPC